MFGLLIQNENASQKFFFFRYITESKCWRDLSSSWQNVHKGDSIVFFKKRNTLSLVYTLSLRFFFLLWRYTLRKDFFPINHKLGILVFHLVLSRGRSLVLNLLFSNFDVTLDRPISVLSNSIHSSKEWWISCWFVCGCFIVSLKAMGIASTTPISLKYWVGKICSQYLGTLKKFARVS